MVNKALCQNILDDKNFWDGKNVSLPNYNRSELPIRAICFSPGRMGFGHLGDIMQDILNQGCQAGLIAGVETFSQGYYNSLAATDWLVSQIIYENEKGVVTPIIQGAFGTLLYINNDINSLAWKRLLDLARDPDVQFATINAPESAYGMVYYGGDFAEPTSPVVKADMENGTFNSDAAKWTMFALERFKAGLKFAFVSCTNFSKNGYFTGATVRTVAKAWEEKGIAPKGFVAYLQDPQMISFPNSMVDRIAVSPDSKTEEIMDNLGIVSNVVVTERTRYWVIEDVFPAGRPELEKADGVFMCENFNEVKKYEDMKLRILNMSHTVIASLGVLLGYRGNYEIYNAMQDKDIVNVINSIIDIVINILEVPKELNPKDFAKNAISRLNNPNIPDDPMRIALNVSTKIMPRLMDTYWEAKEKGMSENELKVILLPVAGFLRYTLGIDDKGQNFELEGDPIKELLIECGSKAKVGDADSYEAFGPLLSSESIMGKNLHEFTETASDLEGLIKDMLSGQGAVRKVLQDYFS